MCKRIERRFVCEPQSAHRARTFVAQALPLGDEESRADLLHTLQLLVTELASNACKSRSKDMTVSISIHRDNVELAVTDSDPAPAKIVPPTPYATTGRGMVIVDAVSSEWGQRPLGDGGKQVWCRVPALPEYWLGLECSL